MESIIHRHLLPPKPQQVLALFLTLPVVNDHFVKGSHRNQDLHSVSSAGLMNFSNFIFRNQSRRYELTLYD